MIFKWFRHDERGSIIVIVAIALSVLLGFAGFAVDYGTLAMTRQELQNAADAAALAAGQDKANGLGIGSQTSTANAYIQANGYTPGDGVTTSQVDSSGNRVTVTITTQKKVGFSSVLTGEPIKEVSATAVAEVMITVGNYPYAMFAGETIDDGGSGITGTGNDITIVGNIHSNSSIDLKHASLHGVATAVDSIKVNGGTQNTSVAIPMPSTNSIVTMVQNNCYYVDGNIILKKNDKTFEQFLQEAAAACPPGPNGLNIYINGSITSQGNDTTEYVNTGYPINIVVTGEIDLNGCTLSSHLSAPMVLVSLNGDVTVNGGGAGFAGLVFAEKGDVTLNGNEADFTGSIYAKNIRKNGGKMTVAYSSDVANHLPMGKVRLVA